MTELVNGVSDAVPQLVKLAAMERMKLGGKIEGHLFTIGIALGVFDPAALPEIPADSDPKTLERLGFEEDTLPYIKTGGNPLRTIEAAVEALYGDVLAFFNLSTPRNVAWESPASKEINRATMIGLKGLVEGPNGNDGLSAALQAFLSPVAAWPWDVVADAKRSAILDKFNSANALADEVILRFS